MQIAVGTGFRPASWRDSENGGGFGAVHVEDDEEDALKRLKQAQEDEELARKLQEELDQPSSSPEESADSLLALNLQVRMFFRKGIQSDARDCCSVDWPCGATKGASGAAPLSEAAQAGGGAPGCRAVIQLLGPP